MIFVVFGIYLKLYKFILFCGCESRFCGWCLGIVENYVIVIFWIRLYRCELCWIFGVIFKDGLLFVMIYVKEVVVVRREV